MERGKREKDLTWTKKH